MKAIRLHHLDGPKSLFYEQAPKPIPKDNQVCVRVYATAITPTEFDWYPTSHTPAGAIRPLPIILGHEFSGVVESVGHPGSVFAYVLEGAVVSQLEGEKAVTYTKGQSWYETPKHPHVVSKKCEQNRTGQAAGVSTFTGRRGTEKVDEIVGQREVRLLSSAV